MLLKQTKIVASISDRRCDVDFIKQLFVSERMCKGRKKKWKSTKKSIRRNNKS